MESKKLTGIDLGNVLGQMNDNNEHQEIDGKKIQMVSIDDIYPDPDQPRKNIDQDDPEIKELAESIKNRGFINFIMVRQEKDGYMIVAGERRWTAAKVLGLKKIPVFVLLSDLKKSEIEIDLLQLEENIKRKDLTPVEEARAYKNLLDQGLKQKQISEKIGRNDVYVSRMLSINNIDESILSDIEKSKNQVSKNILYQIATVEDKKNQIKAWSMIKDNPTQQNIMIAFQSILDDTKENISDLKKENNAKVKKRKNEKSEDSKNMKYAELELKRKIGEVENLNDQVRLLNKSISDLQKENLDQALRSQKDAKELLECIKKIDKLESELKDARIEIQDLKKQNLRVNVKDVTK